MPRVSVIIPTFNCARFLGEAIRSADEQTYTDHEIIVADDGSTDDTKRVVAEYGRKVQYLYQANKGVAAARNLALSRATGEFIAYLDADDQWYPGRLEAQVAFMDAYRACGLVHSDATFIDDCGGTLNVRVNHETRREVPQGYCTMALLRRCHIHTLTVLERRECLEKSGYFDERLRVVEDYLHWIRVALEGYAFGYIDAPLAIHRCRRASLTDDDRRMYEGYALLFEILAKDTRLALHGGREAVNFVNDRLLAQRRSLVYLDRMEGRMREARRGAARLVWESPGHLPCYLELLKSWEILSNMKRAND